MSASMSVGLPECLYACMSIYLYVFTFVGLYELGTYHGENCHIHNGSNIYQKKKEGTE